MAEVKAALEKSFLDAAKQGDIAALKDFLAQGVSLQAHDDGNTALFYAAQYGRMEAVLFLLQKGIPPDVKNRIGSTPLMGAASHGHKDVARLMVDLGSDPRLKNYTGSSAYSYARGAGHEELADMLLEKREPDTVVVTRQVGDVTLSDIFNFKHADRLAVLRRGASGPVEAVQRDGFDSLDKDLLKRAFDAYAKKGGTRPETDFFPAPPAPPPVSEAPRKKHWWSRG